MNIWGINIMLFAETEANMNRKNVIVAHVKEAR